MPPGGPGAALAHSPERSPPGPAPANWDVASALLVYRGVFPLLSLLFPGFPLAELPSLPLSPGRCRVGIRLLLCWGARPLPGEEPWAPCSP